MDASHVSLSVLLLLLLAGCEHIRADSEEAEEEEIQTKGIEHQEVYRCDACRAISYQVYSAFASELRSELSSATAETSERIMDRVCNDKHVWKDYGLKRVNGVNRLTGRGLPANIMEGEMLRNTRYPGELANFCRTYKKRISHEELLAVYAKSPTFLQSVEEYLCFDRWNLSFRAACSWMRPRDEL